MSGLDRHTMRRLDEPAHLRQSIADILTTPRVTRVMRPRYGSDLPRLKDSPLNGETQVDLFQATAEAIAAWEPRIRLTRVRMDEAGDGHATLRLFVERADGTSDEIDVVVRGIAA